MKLVNFDAVDALDDLPAMEALAVELAEVQDAIVSTAERGSYNAVEPRPA